MINKTRLMLMIFIATTGIALLSFIALPLGIMGFGVFSLGLVIYTERQRRSFWERAASMKFKTLKERLERLSGRVNSNRDNIETIRSDTKNKPSQSPETIRAFMPEPDLPRAIKPGMQVKAKPEKPPAPDTKENDDSYDFISDIVVKALIHNAVDREKIEVFVQPIVRLPQRQTRFYELFARIRAKPGLYLPAARYMKLAEQDNMQGSIDDLLLLHSLKTIEESAHLTKAAPFFINITGATLRNGHFMKRLLAFLSRNRHLAPRLVFEISQRDFNSLEPQSLEVLKGLGVLGCSFSLDHTEGLEFDVAALMRLKVRFVKMDAQWLLSTASSPEGHREVIRSKSRLEGNGIGVIFEKIETEDQMRALLDFDIHYGQGYLFGKPGLQGAYKDRTRVRRA